MGHPRVVHTCIKVVCPTPGGCWLACVDCIIFLPSNLYFQSPAWRRDRLGALHLQLDAELDGKLASMTLHVLIPSGAVVHLSR